MQIAEKSYPWLFHSIQERPPRSNKPLHFDEVGHKPASQFIMHALLSDLANRFVSGNDEPIKFGIVDTEEKWRLVRALRLKIYNEGGGYLKNLVNEEGVDAYDANSFVFYASHQNRFIGTIRLNRFPFETSEFIEIPRLQEFLGQGWNDQYLEISRLGIDSACGIAGVSNALVVYASLITACSTQYKFYLAYSHPKLRDRVFKFEQHKEMLTFRIPGRRATDYVLFKGVFWEDFAALIANHGEQLFDSLRRHLYSAGVA